MKILFAGSPSIAVTSLEALCNSAEFELAGVLTNPDTPRGRHGDAQPTDVGEAALKNRVTQILKPVKLDGGAREQVSALKPDILVSFAYGKIFGPKFLSIFPMGGINIHPSLLPRYRGPTPIQAAILNRDTETGITIQWLAKEMDCGDIITQEKFQLTGKETQNTLGEIVSGKAARMMIDTLRKIEAGNADGIPQNHPDIKIETSYCKMISKEDGVIGWNESALSIEAKIRAFDPWPLCRTMHNGRELLILKADMFEGGGASKEALNEGLPGEVLGFDKNCGILIRTGKGILAVTQLQYQAKKALFWRDFLNGARDFTGTENCRTRLGVSNQNN